LGHEGTDTARHQALVRGLATVRSLEAFPRWLPVPRLEAPGLDRSAFFPLLEFATVRQMYHAEAVQTRAAAFIQERAVADAHEPGPSRFGGRPALLAVLDGGAPPGFIRAQAGAGIQALLAVLAEIDRRHTNKPDLEVALASEEEHGTLGWLTFEPGGKRRFWPAFPERFGQEPLANLSESEFREQVRPQVDEPDLG
jgi:hypothetical protein